MDSCKIYDGKSYEGYCKKFEGIVEIKVNWIVENTTPPTVHKMTGFECPYGKENCEIVIKDEDCSVFQAAVFNE